MERIERNPYRILGVNVGAPLSAEVNHLSRIRAFAKVGQEVAFHPAGDELLPPAVRSMEAAEAAVQTLSLPRDRVAHALFWLSGSDSDWGRELDNAVGALIRADYAEAVASYGRLVAESSKRQGFVEAATHGLLDLSEFELSEMVISLLSREDISISRLIQGEGALPTGEIAQRLLEIELPKLQERLCATFTPVMLIHEDDYLYDSIDRFQTAVEDLKPVCRAVGEIFGYDSVDYKGTSIN